MTLAATSPTKMHPVTRYAMQVVSGQIVAGEMVRMAGARHLRDLARQGTADFPYVFHEESAHDAYDWFEENLCHYEGELDGAPFILNDWEMFTIGSLFGWVGADGYRRFRTAYVETGKGSGKTPLAAGIGLHGMVADGEPGAQVFAAATTSEQAGLLFKDARAMAKKSPNLARALTIHEHNVSSESQNSYFRAVSSEAGNLHGKRPHIGLVDEVHVHKDDEVVEALRAGTKSRRQALIFMITNSGQDRRSLAWRYHEYSRRILEQSAIDEQWFAYVCMLDVCGEHRAEGKDMPVDGCEGCDQWSDESVWVKANPSLPEIPGYKYLREQVNEAHNMPAKADNVKRLNMCIWTSGKVQWIRPEVWRAQHSARDIAGRPGFGGYDFSAVNDMTAAAYVFPDADGDGIDIVLRLFLPEERIDELAQQSKVPYRQWVDAGLIYAIPGSTINYNFVREKDREVRSAYQIRSSGIDPWQSIQFRADLEADGVEIVTIPQTNQRLHAVVEEAERLMKLQGFRHGGHPVLEWVASNVVLNIDGRGFKRIDKQASPEKIDPMAAILNALSEAMSARQEDPETKIWFA